MAKKYKKRLKRGKTKTIKGKTYKLGKTSRWERVTRQAPAAITSVGAASLGTGIGLVAMAHKWKRRMTKKKYSLTHRTRILFGNVSSEHKASAKLWRGRVRESIAQVRKYRKIKGKVGQKMQAKAGLRIARNTYKAKLKSHFRLEKRLKPVRQRAKGMRVAGMRYRKLMRGAKITGIAGGALIAGGVTYSIYKRAKRKNSD